MAWSATADTAEKLLGRDVADVSEFLCRCGCRGEDIACPATTDALGYDADDNHEEGECKGNGEGDEDNEAGCKAVGSWDKSC